MQIMCLKSRYADLPSTIRSIFANLANAEIIIAVLASPVGYRERSTKLGEYTYNTRRALKLLTRFNGVISNLTFRVRVFTVQVRAYTYT